VQQLSIYAALLWLGQPGVMSAAARAPNPPPAPAIQAAATPEDAVERIRAVTVLIEGEGVYGSGLLIVPRRGLILTNQHVIEGVAAPRVTLVDGREAPARVLEIDRALDLALLEGPKVDAPPPTFGDPLDLRAAQTVYAIGAPRRLGFTVSRGIVSYVGRPMEGVRYIQTDLAINDGNSGGPVLTARGDVVGIMTFILKRSTGLAFALPINYAIDRFAARFDGGLSADLARLRARLKDWQQREARAR
jgi:S1-C subfamily serine protease